MVRSEINLEQFGGTLRTSLSFMILMLCRVGLKENNNTAVCFLFFFCVMNERTHLVS